MQVIVMSKSGTTAAPAVKWVWSGAFTAALMNFDGMKQNFNPLTI